MAEDKDKNPSSSNEEAPNPPEDQEEDYIDYEERRGAETTKRVADEYLRKLRKD